MERQMNTAISQGIMTKPVGEIILDSVLWLFFILNYSLKIRLLLLLFVKYEALVS